MQLNLTFFILSVVCFLRCVCAQPLPAADAEAVKSFKLALDAVFGMGIRLQAFLLEDTNENFLVSPLSAAVTVGQLMLGAEGEFREQLVDLLQLPNSHHYENSKFKHKNMTIDLPYSVLHLQLSSLLNSLENSSNKSFVLKQKSALFANSRIQLKDEFRSHLRRFYETRVHKLDFSGRPQYSQKQINNWVSRHTNGLIPTLLAQPPSPQTAAIFANAIYFLAEWEIPFSDVLNRRGPFNVSSTKQVEITYMVGFLEQILYAESSEYRVISLPYKNEELGMYIILPRPENRAQDIKTFSQNLRASEVLDTIAKARRRDVVVKMPKMSVGNSFSILEQLKKYRVFKQQQHHVKPNTSATNVVDKIESRVDVFTNVTSNLDVDEDDIFLTNAAVNRKLRIDDIVQQVVVTVNEKGTEAAAVSATTIDYIGGSKNFVIDHPFIFFIRHESTSATLFWGTISNPS